MRIEMIRIILASASPRRREIMERMDIPFEVFCSSVVEKATQKEPAAMVQELAALKAEDVANGLLEKKNSENLIVIGADTMVFCGGNALGKPKDAADAVRILQMLSGREHEVYTGVSIILTDRKEGKKNIRFSVCTRVAVQPLTMEQILDYVATGEPMDKAGAYGIQGEFGIYIREIVGDYYNIVGLPIAKIYETLLNQGIDIKKIK
jgi:septum formation protein